MSKATQHTHYVILRRQPTDVGSSIRPISRLCHEDEEAVRRKLLAPTYQVFRRYASKANAEGFKNQIHALGVDSFIVSDTQIRGHLFLWAKSANQGSGGMAIIDFEEKPLYCPFDDILAVVMMEVRREDASTTKFIDIHRRSTPVTPRLDASLFDFDGFLQSSGAGPEAMLLTLEDITQLVVDRNFNAHLEEHRAMALDFGCKPGEFAPKADTPKTRYHSKDVEAADLYSFVVRAAIIHG